MQQLNNKVFVITGAGSGIGQALALALDQAGARSALNDINIEALANTAAMLSKPPITHAFSVADREQWNVFKAKVLAEFGSVDGVINNAGIAHEAVGVEHLREADLKQVMDINFYGVVNGTQTFLSELAKRPEAAMVNISSIFGITAVGLQSAYCASKFAVRGYTESLRMEALHYYPNLVVSLVHPGGIQTNIADSAISAGSRTEQQREKDLTAFKQAFVTSSEQAASVIVKGIQSKNNRILVGLDAKMLDYTARLLPVGYSKHILGEMKKRGLLDEALSRPVEGS